MVASGLVLSKSVVPFCLSFFFFSFLGARRPHADGGLWLRVTKRCRAVLFYYCFFSFCIGARMPYADGGLWLCAWLLLGQGLGVNPLSFCFPFLIGARRPHADGGLWLRARPRCRAVLFYPSVCFPLLYRGTKVIC